MRHRFVGGQEALALAVEDLGEEPGADPAAGGEGQDRVQQVVLDAVGARGEAGGEAAEPEVAGDAEVDVDQQLAVSEGVDEAGAGVCGPPDARADRGEEPRFGGRVARKSPAGLNEARVPVARVGASGDPKAESDGVRGVD